MEKKKSVPLPSSSSEGDSSSGDEDKGQVFLRNERKGSKIEGAEESHSDEESDSEEESEEDEEHDEIDGTQAVKGTENSSSETEEPSSSDEGSDSESEKSSDSEVKHGKSVQHSDAVHRKPDNANGQSGKKSPADHKAWKSSHKPEVSPKKDKNSSFKRDREATPETGKASSKKHKREGLEVIGKTTEQLPKSVDREKTSKGKGTPSSVSDRKESTKSARATAFATRLEREASQQNSARKSGTSSAKQAAEKGKVEKKAMKQDDSGPLKGSLSPVKPKNFTGKDELVLTTEILHDVKKGAEIPTKKTDGYWSILADRLHDRMEDSRSKEQLCEKTKRMKVRYLSMAEKFKEIGEQKFRNTADKELFSLWDRIWGSSGATEVDHTSKVKNRQSKVSATERPAKEVKTSNDKGAPMQDAKVVIEESEEHDDSGDESDGEDSDGHHDSQKKGLIAAPMEVDKQDDHDKHAFVQKSDSDNLVFQPACKEHDVLHREILATLTEIQESSRQTMKEWKSKALFVIENAVKTLVDQSRTLSGFEIGGLDGCFSPSRSISLGVKEVDEVDQALQHQWHELRLKELELYGQRLELMRMECKLKQDQMRLKLQQDK